jgi:hypothetical protein
MYEAGKADGSKMLASKAYARYDCDNSKLCVLVMAEPNVYFVEGGDSWLKLYGLGQSTVSPIGAIKHVKDGNDIVRGWEGCFSVANYYGGIEIHANYGEDGGGAGRTTSSGRGDYDNTASFNCCGYSFATAKPVADPTKPPTFPPTAKPTQKMGKK